MSSGILRLVVADLADSAAKAAHLSQQRALDTLAEEAPALAATQGFTKRAEIPTLAGIPLHRLARGAAQHVPPQQTKRLRNFWERTRQVLTAKVSSRTPWAGYGATRQPQRTHGAMTA